MPSKKEEFKKDDKNKDEENKKMPDKAKNEVDLTPTIQEQELAFALQYILEDDDSDVDEHTDLLKLFKEDFNVAQRIKKGLVMRRYKAKISNARRRSEARRANINTVKKRAKRRAISTFKQKILKGVNLKDASASEKNRAERVVKRRKAIVDRLSVKLMKDVRASERHRLSPSKNESIDVENKKMLAEALNKAYDSVTN